MLIGWVSSEKGTEMWFGVGVYVCEAWDLRNDDDDKLWWMGLEWMMRDVDKCE